MQLLNNINSPADLKALDDSLLPVLAKEIRKFIIDNVSKTGGHLAPNLGVVELTLALHKIFNVPKDKFVWDVGHQAYIHKIITGRRDKFNTLRQFEGISGFPAIKESKFDAYGTGHASTSLSAALGMAVARDVNKEDHDVVAIIGDGSISGGMAMEALNNIGDLQKRMLIVLNDNEMSIAKNVGAMSEYLYRMRTGPTYARIKKDIDSVLKSIPSIGSKMANTVERVKNSVKFLLVPGMLFEELGITYIGPVDGHDTKLLLEIFNMAKLSNKPVLVHVLTQKGKGYPPAENNMASFHGTGPFVVETGEKINNAKHITYTQVFGETLIELAEKNKKITAITAAMPDGTGLIDFQKKFPDRFFDVGIAEQHAVTMAAGMACGGLIPVVAIYSTFMQRSFDQIVEDICLQDLPVVLALDRTGLVGDDGATHHGVLSFSYLRSIPNLVIMAPKDENELRQMLNTAVLMKKPVAVLYPRGEGLGVELDTEFKEIPLGTSEVVREGNDVCIWAIGSMVDYAKKISDSLSLVGIEASVVNARFVFPMDKNLLMETAKKYKKIVTIEENILAGGFGSAVLQELQELDILDKVKTLTIGLPNAYIPHGKKELLLKSINLDTDSLVEKIKDFCNG